MVEKILVPIDSIEWDNTMNAVNSAIGIAQCYIEEERPEVIFLHVFNVGARISLSERKRLTKIKKEEIKEEFEEIRELCRENGLKKIKTVTSTGDPAKKIIEMAEEKNVNIITIGSGKLHDQSTTGKINKFFYGSVTEKVIHGAPCSIFVAQPEMELNRILVPIDSIEWDNTLSSVKNSINIAGGYCGGNKPELILMHVLHSERGAPPDFKEEKLNLEKKRIKDEFSTVGKMCKKEGLEKIETIVKSGDPEKKKGVDKEIVETAEEEDADLIVMGSGKLHDRSARGRIEKYFYGSVTEDVLHEAPCSVLVARPLE